MAKDLEDDVLPSRKRHASKSDWIGNEHALDGGFQLTNRAPPSLDANWPEIMEKLLRLRSLCVQHRKSPAWTQVSQAGVLLMLP